MKLRLVQARENGRNNAGQLIYPIGSWTVWKGDKFEGWNWNWHRPWQHIWNA